MELLFVGNFSSFAHDLLDVFFEAHFEHHIGLIKHKRLHFREINVAPLDVVFDSSTSSDEDVYTILKLPSLCGDTDSSINSDHRKLSWLMLEHVDLISDLKSQLSRWGKHDSLNFTRAKESVCSQVLDDWERKRKCLTRTCQVSSDEILPLVDWLEAVLLDREEAADTFGFEGCDGLWVDVWVVGEVSWLGRL